MSARSDSPAEGLDELKALMAAGYSMSEAAAIIERRQAGDDAEVPSEIASTINLPAGRTFEARLRVKHLVWLESRAAQLGTTPGHLLSIVIAEAFAKDRTRGGKVRLGKPEPGLPAVSLPRQDLPT